MTISLVAVFIPVLFMGGIVGRLLHEFAVTISVAILVSGFVSISLTPMLCSRFLKPPHTQKHGGRLQRDRADVRRVAQALRRDAARQPALRLRHRRDLDRPDLRDRLPVHGRAQGLPADRGSGALQHQHRRDPGHRLRRHGQAPDGGRRDRREGPRHPEQQQQRRSRPRRRRPQQRPPEPRPEAAQPAQAVGRPDHGGAAAEAGAGAGRPRLHGQPAADQPRRPAGRAQPVPVHPAGHRHRRALRSTRRSSRRRCARCPASRTSAATCRSRTRRSW